jgi:hypothetical protein
MKKLALGALFAGLMAACGGGGSDVKLIDAPENPDDGDVSQVCNPIAQTGCQANEKCTWFIDQVTPAEVGHIGCAPLSGSEVALGAACAEGPPGPQGFDNCSKGDICVALECKKICDPQMAGVASGCDAQHSCSRYSGLFEVGGTITAGACDPQCDPLNQNLLAGAGNTAACGSTDPAAPNKGCYTFDFEAFSCAPVGAATLEKTDRVEPVLSPSGNPFVNGCAPGYVPFFFEATGSMKVMCTGLCAPGETSSQTAPVNETLNEKGDPAGSAKLVTSAAPAVGDGLCTAGKKGSAAGGLQNCLFLWPFLTDANGNPGPSQYNETVGVCFSFTQFQYDANGDMTPETTFPNCKALPKRSAATTADDDDAADFFCQKIANSQFAPSAPQNSPMKDFRLANGPGEAVAHQFK